MRHSDLVYVKRVKGKGRGVFALRSIAKGEVIEKVPILVVPLRFLTLGLWDPDLARFCFWRDRKNVAVCLGYGSIYNHSYRPNAEYLDGSGQTMIFRAIRPIEAGEEITINYNGDPKDKDPVGFMVVETEPRKNGQCHSRQAKAEVQVECSRRR